MFNYNNVRAQTLVTWGDFILYFRYNDFTHDPLSRCNCTPPYSAENAISARCDLNPANGTYPFGALGHRSHGGTDMKVTTFYPISLVQVLTCSSTCNVKGFSLLETIAISIILWQSSLYTSISLWSHSLIVFCLLQ